MLPLSLTVILPTYNERENIPVDRGDLRGSADTGVGAGRRRQLARRHLAWSSADRRGEPACPAAAARTERGLTSAIGRASGRRTGRCGVLDGLRPGDAAGGDPAAACSACWPARTSRSARATWRGAATRHSLMARAFSVRINTLARSVGLGRARLHQRIRLPPAGRCSTVLRCAAITANTASTCWRARDAADCASRKCLTSVARG